MRASDYLDHGSHADPQGGFIRGTAFSKIGDMGDGWLAGRPAGWLACWLAGLLGVWLAGWLLNV